HTSFSRYWSSYVCSSDLYNISTPLISHLLEAGDAIQDMTFMLQKEVVDRLAAPPGGGERGRLSVLAQYFCEVESLFVVPPEAFRSEERRVGKDCTRSLFT